MDTLVEVMFDLGQLVGLGIVILVILIVQYQKDDS